MNKNAIKKYAIWARRELIERVSQRAMMYGITKESAENLFTQNSELRTANGVVLTPTESKQCKALLNRIHAVGFTQVMEEVAYTWFNRFAALRFMEVNGYLPSHVRVFTNDAGEFKPQILAEAIHLELDGLDMKKVYALINENQSEELFKYLLIVQCNALNSILPGMFQRIDDYTELLLPDYLLREGSVIEQMVTTIPEEDWTDQVQIIGWLYQYYNTEPKDKVFADLKKNIKITKENIPAATQLFTPDWIVHYMVENSLGRIAVSRKLLAFSFKSEEERQAKEKEIADSFGWKYYLPEAKQEPEVRKQLIANSYELTATAPTALRVIDPCCGSGHILCVLFDVLVQIYEDYGYTTREAAGKIVENNLWGLDIDERAAQLSYFAVMMKARQYDRRFFTRNVQPHVYSPKGYPEGLEYGSLITVDALEPAPEPSNRGLFDENYSLTLNRWNFRHALSQKYHVVVTNPPYMGNSGMGAKLAEFVKSKYPDSKSDLFACFIERCRNLTNESGYQAMITQHAWMFLGSFEDFRKKVMINDIISLIHLGAHAFEEISGEVVQTTSFVVRKSNLALYKAIYYRLVEVGNPKEKETAFLSREKFYTQRNNRLKSLPGQVLAYWASARFLEAFSYPKMGELYEVKSGLSTGDNELFIRYWFEISKNNFSGLNGYHNTVFHKWVPYNKGGGIRKWYGINNLVVLWGENGEQIRAYGKAVFRNPNYYLREGITWSGIASTGGTFRYCPPGYIFDSNKGPMLFSSISELQYPLGILNSKVTNAIIPMLNPTISLQIGDVVSIPVIDNKSILNKVKKLVNDAISFSKADWDSFETSWDFARHPLLPKRVVSG